MEIRYKEFFEHGQDFLDMVSAELNISPARMYFNTDRSLNACARRINDYFLVEINAGAIPGLIGIIQDLPYKFNRPGLSKYRSMPGMQGAPWLYMVQFLLRYFLYHETGHLVTYSDKTEFNKVEFANGSELVNAPTGHLREMDADWFSAVHLGKYIMNLFNAIGGIAKVGKDDLADVIALMMSTAMLYYIDRNNFGPDLYFAAHSHPHPNVRVTYFLYFLISVMCDEVLGGVDETAITNKMYTLTGQLISAERIDTLTKFNRIRTVHSHEIVAYIKKMMKNIQEVPELCVNRFGGQWEYPLIN